MTSFGINNEGQLVFDYFHSDTDQLEGANVYNGQNSVLWCNFRDAFPDEIKATYQDLRSNGVLNYDELVEQFITKGSDKWSESIYNEDADFKYISMLYEDGDASNLSQVRGTGEEHFRYFVENRLNYCDGKWYAPAYADDYVALRIYTPETWAGVEPNADITVTPFSHMYAGVRYKANGTLYQKRVSANEVTTFEAPDETFNDTETAIYGASQLSSLGDLSPLYCGTINVSKATKLTELIIGSDVEGYSNPNLLDLSVGTNNLLKVLNVRNCPNLTDPLALSGCPNIEEIYAAGSGITGVELADSGYLKVLELPATIANLTLKNQLYIETLTLEGYGAIKTINIENCPTVPSLDILSAATNVERVRLTNVDWTYDTVNEVLALADRNLAGIDENGNNTDKMWIDGKCHIKTLTGAEYLAIKEAFPYMTITYDNLTAELIFMSEDGTTELTRQVVINGADGVDVFDDDRSKYCEIGDIGYSTGALGEKNTRVRTPYISTNGASVLNLSFENIPYKMFVIRVYKTDGSFVNVQNKITSAWNGTFDENGSWCMIGSGSGTFDLNAYIAANGLTANHISHIRLVFSIDDSTPITEIKGRVLINDISHGIISYPFEKPSTAQYDFTFGGWSLRPNGEPNENALKNVEADRTVYVAFNKSLRKYTVKFYNGTTLLETKTVEYGSDATYTGDTPVHPTAPDDCEFRAWKPEPTNIQGDTNCYAQWYDKREITDSWETIAANCANGTYADKYAIGAFKMLDIGVKTLPYDFEQSSAVIYNDEIHILGSSASAYRTSHYKWTGTEWVEVSTLPYEFYYGSAVVYNNEIHIFGGSSTARTKHYKWDGSSWTSVSTLPYKFSEGIAIVYNNEIHIMSSVESSKYTSHYKWTGSEWTEVSVLPYNLYTASAVIYNNELHVLGSYDSNHDTSHYKWNGSTWTSVSTLPQKLSNGHALVVGTDIYMIQWDEFYKYDGTSWSTVPEVPANVYEGCSVVLDGVIYVMGSSVSGNRKVFFSYTPETETWSKVGITESIPMEIIAHNHDELASGYKWEAIAKPTNIPQYGCAVTYQNEVHALGGNSSSSYTQHIKWDDTNSTWVTVSTLPYQFRSGCAVILNDEIHILGSYQTTNKTEHYKWNATDGWVSVSTLPYRFYCSSAVVLNGEIHILGSYDSSSRKYHYKWNGTEWASVSTLPYNFYYGSAVVYNGEIHIFSGSGSSTGHYKWDGSAWTSVSTLPYDLQYGVATIINNEIHIFGGSDNPTGHYKWNGTEWTSMTTLPGNFENYPLAVCNGTPYIFISTSCYKLAGPSWVDLYDSASNVTHVYGGNIFVCGNELYVYSNQYVHIIDTSNKYITTSLIGSKLPYANGYIAVYNDEIHVISASSGVKTNIMKYDVNSNSFIEAIVLPDDFNRYGCNLIEFNGLLYAFGGNNKKYYVWDGSSWSDPYTIPFTYYHGRMIVYNGELHVPSTTISSKSHYKFDGENWTKVCDTPYVFRNSSFAIYQDELHAFGGTNNPTAWYKFNGTEWIDTGAILPGDSDSTAYTNNGACVYKGKLYVLLQNSTNHLHPHRLENPKASLTFLAKNLLKDDRQFNSKNHSYWSMSNLREWCNGEFYNSLPEDLQSSISEVIKVSDTGSAGKSLEDVNDKVWIPSIEEIGYTSVNAIQGQGSYYPVFTNNISRVRMKINSGEGSEYWTRSAATNNINNTWTVKNNGACVVATRDKHKSVLPGFCI